MSALRRRSGKNFARERDAFVYIIIMLALGAERRQQAGALERGWKPMMGYCGRGQESTKCRREKGMASAELRQKTSQAAANSKVKINLRVMNGNYFN